MCKIDSWGKLIQSAGNSAWCFVMTWRDGMVVGWEGGPRQRGYMYAYVDSLQCTAETNKIVKQLNLNEKDH